LLSGTFCTAVTRTPKTTHICVVDADGKVLCRDVVASDPDILAKWLNRHCAELGRMVLETGTLSTFL
jgi:transposase